jgi:hypothetical protein
MVDGRVAPRSGLAAKHGIDTMAGVIDADYRGQVGVILANLSEQDFEIKVGDRIAQLIVEKVRTLGQTMTMLLRKASAEFGQATTLQIQITDARHRQYRVANMRTDCHARSRRRRETGSECARRWWLWQHWRIRRCNCDSQWCLNTRYRRALNAHRTPH